MPHRHTVEPFSEANPLNSQDRTSARRLLIEVVMKRTLMATLSFLIAGAAPAAAWAQTADDDVDPAELADEVAPPTDYQLLPPNEAPAEQPPAPPEQPPAPPVAAQPRVQREVAPMPPPENDVDVPSGQWVYTEQYGWIWMPGGGQYVYRDTAAPYSYVFYPRHGWLWVSSPWVWGWGAYPYFSRFHPWHYAWYRGIHYAGYRWSGHWAGWRGGGWHRDNRVYVRHGGYVNRGGAYVRRYERVRRVAPARHHYSSPSRSFRSSRSHRR
jgi:hypothetical protein